jgi:AbrB family looped-hinge helix DNA binding protein
VGCVEATVRVDEKGRVPISKDIRRALGVSEVSTLKLGVENGRIVLEPIGSIADRFYGVF